jgi:hypothetical protein
MNLSVLQKKPKLILEPYPHFVIEDALPQDVYEQLEQEWPKEQLLSTEPFDQGICYRLKADEMLKPGKVSMHGRNSPSTTLQSSFTRK